MKKIMLRSLVSSLCIMLVLLLAACSSTPSSQSGVASTPTSDAQSPATSVPAPTKQTDSNSGQPTNGQPTTASTQTTYQVKVFFSKSPETDQDFSKVFPVNRVSPDLNVATYTIKQLIAGPTTSEQGSGYYSSLKQMISGSSLCPSGEDFQLTLNKRGTRTEQGTATIKFCRQLASPGIGADARVQSEIEKSLTQFPTIQRVAILTQENHCFGDESGLDRCLK